MVSAGRPSDRSDGELLRAVGAGDAAAFEVLYERHAAWLLQRLGRCCSDRHAADEVLQDTFVAVWQGASSYEGSGPVGAWMWTIARRRSVDAWRRSPPAGELLDDHDVVQESVERRALSRLEHGPLAAVVAQLRPIQRSVVIAVLVDGLTVQQAADTLGIAPGTVKSRLHHAKRRMREALRLLSAWEECSV